MTPTDRHVGVVLALTAGRSRSCRGVVASPVTDTYQYAVRGLAGSQQLISSYCNRKGSGWRCRVGGVVAGAKAIELMSWAFPRASPCVSRRDTSIFPSTAGSLQRGRFEWEKHRQMM